MRERHHSRPARRVSTARAQRRRAQRQKTKTRARVTRRWLKPWQQALVGGLAAVLVLAAAGWGAWGYIDDRWLSGARVLATVGDHGVTLSEVNARARLWEFVWRGPVTQGELLNELVDEHLVLGEAAARGLLPAESLVQEQVDQILASLEMVHESPTGVSRAMRSARVSRAQLEDLVRAWLATEGLFAEVTGDISVTAEEIRAHYEEHLELYAEPRQVTVRHILVETEAEAEEIRRLLEAGEDFAELARSRSLDPGTRDSGGELSWPVTADDTELVPEFVAAAVSLDEGQLSAPVRTSFGYHVIRADKVVPARQPALEEVEDQIGEELLAERRSGAFEVWLEGLRTAAPVRSGTD